jgi:ABC-type branched-subunit amino acid transport system substrate-binding protein
MKAVKVNTYAEYVKNSYKNKPDSIGTYHQIKKKLKDKINPNELAFGQITNFSGQHSVYSRQIFCGITSCFMTKNDSGGLLKKHFLRLVPVDDCGDPILSQKIERLLFKKYKIKTFIGNMGERNLLAILPDIKNNNILSLFPYAFNKLLFSQHLPNVFNGTNNKELLINKILDFVLNEQRLKNIAIFYPNDELGIYLAKYTEQKMLFMKTKPIAKISYNQKHMQILSSVDILKKIGPDAIICLGDFMPSCRLISQFSKNNAIEQKQYDSPETIFIGTEELFFAAKILENCLPSYKSNIYFSSYVPLPIKSKCNYKIVAKYLRDLKTYFPNEEASPLGLSYYINAKLIIKILEDRLTFTSKEVTPSHLFEILQKGFKNIGYKDLGGIIASNSYGLKNSVYPLEPKIFNLRKKNKTHGVLINK